MIRESFAVFPFAPALLAAVVETIPIFPFGAGGCAVAGPDDLWIGPDEVVSAPTLLFEAVTAVEQLIVAPAIGDDEGRALDGSGHAWSEREAKRDGRQCRAASQAEKI